MRTGCRPLHGATNQATHEKINNKKGESPDLFRGPILIVQYPKYYSCTIEWDVVHCMARQTRQNIYK